MKNPQTAGSVAESWESWCGKCRWTKRMREFGEVGGLVIWYCGYPQSKSAIPLCFTLHDDRGMKIITGGDSRLKDIEMATYILSVINKKTQ